MPKVIEVRVLGNEEGEVHFGSRVFLQYSGTGGTTAEYNSFASSVASAWSSDLAASTTADYTLTEVQVIDLSSATSPTGLWTGTEVGTRAGAALAQNVAYTLNYETALRRRGGHFHGQWRWGTASDLANSRNWTTGAVTSLNANFVSFMTAILADVWSGGTALAHVGVQYYGPPNRTITGSTGRVRTVSTLLAAPVTYSVTGYAAFTRLGSQRRRLGKSGT